MWFNKFSKIPCIENDLSQEQIPAQGEGLYVIEQTPILGGAEGESSEQLPNSNCNYFPHFIKSVVKKTSKVNIEILDLETQIINKYLQWFYRPTILGPSKCKFVDMRKCNINNYNFLYFYTDLTYNNPFHYTLYYNKLWMQLMCYRTSPNSFLNDILDESYIDESYIDEPNIQNYYNKYSDMLVQLTHLFPFVISINILKTKINTYYKLDLDIEQYYTIENIEDYDYLGYINIPFDIDSRNIRPENQQHLHYFLFRHKVTDKILISGHRNKIYSFFQKETPNYTLVELNIIGYLNKWNNRYDLWTLYPYLVIYTSKYKYYKNLYETTSNHKTNIYISSLKYEELVVYQHDLNNRLYNDEISNDNIRIQLQIPSDEDLIDINNNIHLYIIPIIPILCHKNVKFVCPNQDTYIIKDYQSLIEYIAPLKITEGKYKPSHLRGGNNNKYFKKYLKYKLKYKKLLNDNS